MLKPKYTSMSQNGEIKSSCLNTFFLSTTTLYMGVCVCVCTHIHVYLCYLDLSRSVQISPHYCLCPKHENV